MVGLRREGVWCLAVLLVGLVILGVGLFLAWVTVLTVRRIRTHAPCLRSSHELLRPAACGWLPLPVAGLVREPGAAVQVRRRAQGQGRRRVPRGRRPGRGALVRRGARRGPGAPGAALQCGRVPREARPPARRGALLRERPALPAGLRRGAAQREQDFLRRNPSKQGRRRAQSALAGCLWKAV